MTSKNPDVAARSRIGKRPGSDEYDDDLIRQHWRTIAPMGRHRYALSRLTALVAGTAFFSVFVGAIPLNWFLGGGPTGDERAWLLVLGVPSLVAAYNLLLGRYDRDAEDYGGVRGRVTMDAWREAADATGATPEPPVLPDESPPANDARES